MQTFINKISFLPVEVQRKHSSENILNYFDIASKMQMLFNAEKEIKKLLLIIKRESFNEFIK